MDKYYNPQEIEPAMQALWEEYSIYKFDREGDGEVYSIDTPPPTVSGSLHVGHIFSYVQAEMIARYRRSRGYRVFYPFGFDDNGLPTERLVEKEQGLRARDLPRGEFNARCMETASAYEEDFIRLWKSLGFSVDWELNYRTIDPEVQKLSQASFLELAQSGHAYHKESPVLWCTECQTSIAQAELETKDVDAAFYHLAFLSEGSPVAVATTRPELLYGCVCLFIHPDNQKLANLIGKQAVVPLYNYEIPILADEKADPEKGSGVVMCATYGDTTDVQWCEEHSLPYRRVIQADGRLDEAVPFLGGLRVAAARREVVRLLEEANLLLRSEELTHAVAVHERCGRPVEILPSRQWYIDVLTNRQRYLDAANEINWYPAHMKARYTAWVENLKWDWCISRQRYFGVPFPVWYCEDCGKAHFSTEAQLPVNPLEAVYVGICACGCTRFTPETSVMDTWATSSLTPVINRRHCQSDAEREQLLPMTMRTQAHEIIRTWTFYTIVKSLYHTGKLPWKDVMICGFVLAKKGEKISKSKSNSSLEPKALIEAHSADAVRYWAASAKLGTDTFFAVEELAGAKRFLTKLWNAAKFSMLHLEEYTPDHWSDEQLLPVDRWMVARANQCAAEVAEQLDAYEIGLARHLVDELFWKDFCDNYLEIVKERLYQPEIHGEAARLSGQRALHFTLLQVLKLYAPFVPHITEYLYQSFFRERMGKLSLHLIPVNAGVTGDDAILSFGEALKAVVADMRRIKSERGLSMKAELEALTVQAEQRHMAWFRETEGDLRACSRAATIHFYEKEDV